MSSYFRPSLDGLDGELHGVDSVNVLRDVQRGEIEHEISEPHTLP